VDGTDAEVVQAKAPTAVHYVQVEPDPITEYPGLQVVGEVDDEQEIVLDGH